MGGTNKHRGSVVSLFSYTTNVQRIRASCVGLRYHLTTSQLQIHCSYMTCYSGQVSFKHLSSSTFSGRGSPATSGCSTVGQWSVGKATKWSAALATFPGQALVILQPWPGEDLPEALPTWKPVPPKPPPHSGVRVPLQTHKRALPTAKSVSTELSLPYEHQWLTASTPFALWMVDRLYRLYSGWLTACTWPALWRAASFPPVNVSAIQWAELHLLH